MQAGSDISIDCLKSAKSRPYSTCVAIETVKKQRTMKTICCYSSNRSK